MKTCGCEAVKNVTLTPVPSGPLEVVLGSNRAPQRNVSETVTQELKLLEASKRVGHRNQVMPRGNLKFNDFELVLSFGFPPLYIRHNLTTSGRKFNVLKIKSNFRHRYHITFLTAWLALKLKGTTSGSFRWR